jgi:hypothetical protein
VVFMRRFLVILLALVAVVAVAPAASADLPVIPLPNPNPTDPPIPAEYPTDAPTAQATGESPKPTLGDGEDPECDEDGCVDEDGQTEDGFVPAPQLAAAIAIPGPSNCQGQSNDPHRSAHVPNTVNYEARTWRCSNNQPSIRARAQLWEHRWWGWSMVGQAGDVTAHNVKQVSAFGNFECRNNTFRGTGFHENQDVNQLWYNTRTESRHIKNPCG